MNAIEEFFGTTNVPTIILEIVFMLFAVMALLSCIEDGIFKRNNVTIREASYITGLSINTIRRYVDNGYVISTKRNNRIYISKESLKRVK